MSNKFNGMRARNYWFDDGENSREVIQLHAGGKHLGFTEYATARKLVDQVHDLCDEHERKNRNDGLATPQTQGEKSETSKAAEKTESEAPREETDTFDARVINAHREAFALVTVALNNPDGVDLEPQILDYMTSGHNPIQRLTDLTQVLVWHAMGAIATHSGDLPSALNLVQEAALIQESMFIEKGNDND